MSVKRPGFLYVLSAVLVVIVLLLSGCGGRGKPSEPTRTTARPASVDLQITNRGELFAFDPTTLNASAGQAVTVTFSNSSANAHTWVLVRGGDAVASQVDQAGASSGSPDFLPSDRGSILAATKLVGPGTSQSVRFTAPAPGTYTYLCTFPGHYAAGMKGQLVVS